MTAPTADPPLLGRARFFASASEQGVASDRGLIRTWTAHVDAWLATLFVRALGDTDGDAVGVSLVAVGGYGRGELCPQSDLDVMLLHRNRPDIVDAAERLWYPVWDEGVKLGHAVRTPKEALGLASEDLDTATSLLELRHVAGDPELTEALAKGAVEGWRKRGRRWLGRLSDSVEARHATTPEVAFHLEPDLKSGRGGLRDVHALRWATETGRVVLDGDRAPVDEGYETLLAVRVALHRLAPRSTDLLTLQDQDAVAAELGLDADQLMAAVASAGRAIAWRSDETWHRTRSMLAGRGRGLSLARPERSIGPGLMLVDDEVHLAADADLGIDPALVLRAGAEAARRGVRIARSGLDRMATETTAFTEPWPDGALSALVDLLLAGHGAMGVIEALDQVGVWTLVLPEWAPLRSRPQRNAYHRFTVDRHLCECAANAAGLIDRVRRADLLVLGALFHDIGKNGTGDHTDVGIELVGAIGPRLGLPPEDVTTLVAMVRHHLLLPDVAPGGTWMTRPPSTSWPRPSATSGRCSCWMPSPKPTRSPPVRPPGDIGRRASWPSWSIAPRKLSGAGNEAVSGPGRSRPPSNGPCSRRVDRWWPATVTC
ncbi:MAG: HD domain-containing protein [Acidimicrobiales bacterium]